MVAGRVTRRWCDKLRSEAVSPMACMNCKSTAKPEPEWSDTDSFALLDEVIGGDDAPSLLVVFTHRSGDMDANNHLESLSSLVASKGSVLNLQVGELSCEDSLHLAASLLGAEQLNGPALEAIARESAD